MSFVMFEHAGATLPVSSDSSRPRNMSCQMSIHEAREKLKYFEINENKKAVVSS